MVRRRTKIAMGRPASIAMGLVLAVVGLAALPAGPASAASSVVSWWGTASSHFERSGSIYSCGGSWQINQGSNPVLQVYNPCSGRVWVHYYDYNSGTYSSYCVNPGGGLAYDIPIRWSTGDASDIQLSANTSPCDVNGSLVIDWIQGATNSPRTYGCEYGSGIWTGHSINVTSNGCAARVWLHEHDDGTGNAVCVSPDAGRETSTGAYWQFQETLNQAPCGAGAPKYAY